MKLLSSIMALFLFALGNSAQTLPARSAEPEVAVISKKWRIDVRNPALEKDPIQAMNDREKEERRRKETERLNETLNEQGMPTQTARVPEASRKTGRTGISVTYIYEMKIRNTGPKEIRRLTWDYVFFEPGTETEVGRRQFISKVNLSPGGTTKVVVRAAASPAGAIDARKAGKKPQDQYSEQIAIQEIEYADGSVWRGSGPKIF